MTNPKRGECEISLAGQTFQTKLNLDSIMRIETATQRSFLKLANELSEADFQMSHIVFILQTAIKGGGSNMGDAEMKRLIWDAGIAEAITAVGVIMARVITGGEEQEGNDEGAAKD